MCSHLPLAGDDATAPRQAAAAAAAATATDAAPATAAAAATSSAAAATAAASAAAAAASAAATTTAGILLPGPVHPPAFLVKYKEGAKRHVRDLFLGEGEFVIRYDVLGRHVRCDRRSRCCGCAARQRQRPNNSAQHGDGFLHTPSLRCSLRLPHVRSSNAYRENGRRHTSVRPDERARKPDCARRLGDSPPLWRDAARCRLSHNARGLGQFLLNATPTWIPEPRVSKRTL